MRFLFGSVALLSLTCGNLAYAVNSCEIELTDENISTIAYEIAGHALDPKKDHAAGFVTPSPKKPNAKKIPWTLDEQTDLAQFISDIMQGLTVASRDDQTPLNVRTRVLANDRVAWVELNTGTFVVYEPTNEDCGSSYRRDYAEEYFNEQE